ncbi:DUF1414 domain-containing protein [Rheinheimera muenzenbergensis]|uniref:UPF0352 protein MN202_13850 n=1 Tax=Rheinheimera muenzenbergensis TaxID=1193628 RepID=A0ABU8C9H1_9GAMM|nr:DUF1414 domain-containing protein [Gammaproteobacteria bacterium]MBU1553642.1 DUF1414 domain-containing protein [Gammaproteobacteria bacterium]MBU2070167.1 DUF1414 domain-containing protein [Gammaproteobacteria bacterium]MBU2183582.1 DUF1414 domain-containing protein [Gammaproteobacteria bacterium]MBU2204733.1 DUF1414 domain-containing protein [Gammaproteobacteria bacterium]
MPIVSKYSTAQIEKLVNQLLDVLHADNATTELSLMCLGNAISHVVNSSVPAAQRADVVKHFNQALTDAINSKAN